MAVSVPKSWNPSVSLTEIEKEKRLSLRLFDSSRVTAPPLPAEYLSPAESASRRAKQLNARNLEYSDLRSRIEANIIETDPTISLEGLRAKLFRSFNHQVDRIENGVCERPLSRLVTRPLISLTCKSRRYKHSFHTGVYSSTDSDIGSWSCCSSSKIDSRGCEYRMIDPDAWCVFP